MASFQISQQSIIQTARNKVLDGDWRDGLNYLVDSFTGMTLDIACSILSGQKTISDEALIDENDTEYKQEFQDIYSYGLFWNDNVLYEQTRLITMQDIHNSIVMRNISHDIPKAVEYVELYMLEKNEQAFLIESSSSKYIAVIAKKKDKNSLPLWLKYEDFYSSYKKLYQTLYPERKTESVSKIEYNTSSLDSFDIKYKEAIALNTATAHGFENTKDFSTFLREPILKAIKEKGISWKEMNLTLEGKEYTLKYPYDVAMAFALSKTPLKNIAPKWQTVSKSGIKMDNDSALHTDLWLSMGYDLNGSEYIKSNTDYILFNNLVSELQKTQFKGSDFTILNSCSLNSFSGHIVDINSKNITKKDIIVIPHAGPEFQVQAFKAGLVICEVGGKLSHLAIVGREEGVPLIRVDNAMKLFSTGTKLSINFETAEIHVSQ